MTLQINRPPSETARRIEEAITSAIPDAQVAASGTGGHFEIKVVSAAFVGKNTLAKQRLVYRAIADLMKGEAAPVHAVDRLETLAPGE